MLEPNGKQPQIGDFPFTGECEAVVRAYHTWKNRLLDAAVDNPTESLFLVMTSSAWVFYQAEKDVNPEVKTYGDAIHYISTCLSVGYARIFPVTQTGKLVATVVMAIGPALTSWMLEGRLVQRQAQAAAEAGAIPPSPAPAPPDFTPVVAKLDEILREMRAQQPARQPEGE